MSSEKKAIVVFTDCPGSALMNTGLENIDRVIGKGAMLGRVDATGDFRQLASRGSQNGESLWDAAAAADLNVRDLDQDFDICLLEGGEEPFSVDAALAGALQHAERLTTLVLVARGMMCLYGYGVAKGLRVDRPLSPTCMAPTLAYILDFPVPQGCEGAIVYEALKNINFKRNEIEKLQKTIDSLNTALERGSVQTWDKHDCA